MMIRLHLLGFCCLMLFGQPAFAQTLKFTEQTAWFNVPGNRDKDGVSCYGHGVIMADINKDNRPDIYISNAVRYANKLPETLYLSSSDGKYVESDKARRVEDSYGWTGSHGLCWVDYDNDGDYDIYNATTDDRNRLYKNDGNGYFDDVTDLAMLPLIRVLFPDFDSVPYGYGTRGVVAFDANGDGFMDLLGVNWGPAEKRYDENTNIVIPPQPNEFYLNNGDGTFTMITNSGLTEPPNHSYMGTQGVTACDVDGDDDMDVLIVHRNYTAVTEDGEIINGFNPDYEIPNQLFINDGTGHFTDETRARGLWDVWNDANGATFADFDNDGDMDLFVPPKEKTREWVRVFVNDGTGHFDNETDVIKIKQWGFGTNFLDADNDGDLDAFAPMTRENLRFYRNNGNSTFTQLTGIGTDISAYDPRGAAIGDVDDDGDQDIYYVDANKNRYPIYSNRLLRNDTNKSYGWLKVTGTGPGGDMGGFGAKIWVYEQGRVGEQNALVGYREVTNAYGYLCQDDPVQHFGLATRTAVDVKVRMLDGTTLVFAGAPANTRLFFSKPTLIAKTGGDNQSAPSDSLAPLPLVVRVLNKKGEPVRGGQVTFSSSDAGGSFEPSDVVYADADGYVSVRYRLGGQLNQTVTAQCITAPNASVLFSVTSTGSNVGGVTIVSGNNQKGPANATLPAPLVIRVTNSFGNPAANIPVTFKVMSGNGQVNGAATFATTTNAQGQAQANWTLGPNLSTTQTVDAYPTTAPETVAHFTAASFGSAARLVLSSPSHVEGTVNRYIADSLAVRVTDNDGNGIRQVSVVFAVTAGSGFVNGQSQVTVVSNASGYAKVRWRLGKTAGVDNQSLRITANGLTGSPATITATALAGLPVQLVKISGDSQTVDRNQPLPNPLVVAVLDSFANSVSNQPVTFQRVTGDGGFAGQGSTTLNTNSAGQASAIFTAGVADSSKIQVSSLHQGLPLKDSPQTFTVKTRPLAPSQLVKVDGDGQKGRINMPLPAPLRVQVLSAAGTPMPNISVEFRANSGGASFGGYPTLTTATNANGIAAATPTLGAAVGSGVYSFSANAVYDGRHLIGSPVTFVASGLLTNAVSVVLVSPDSMSGAAGTTLSDSIRVRVYDSNNVPVRNQPVILTVFSGGSRLNGSLMTVTANSNVFGEATAAVKLAATPETSIIRIHANNGVDALQPGVIEVKVRTLSGPASKFFALNDLQTQTPGEVLPQPIGVLVTDAANYPIQGLNVTFMIVDGGGAMLESMPQPTDESGRAFANWRLGPQVGQQHAKASFAGLPTQVTFTATAQQQSVPHLEILSGDLQIVAVNNPAPDSLVAQLVSATGAPVPGKTILFSVVGGAQNGAIISPAQVTTNAQGRVSAKYQAGQATGIQRIRAESATYGYVEFTIHVEFQRSFTFVKTSEDGMTAKPREMILCSLRVFDALGRPAPAENLVASVKKGGGWIDASSAIKTSATGEAAVAWRLGPVGEQELLIQPVNGAGSVVFTVTVANQVPVFTRPMPLVSAINILVGEKLVLPVAASDADDDQVFYAATVLPKGATFDQKELWEFSWTPTSLQVGRHAISFVAADIYGAADTLKLQVDVTEEPQYFTVTSRHPEVTTQNLDYGQSVLFSVQVQETPVTIYWYSGAAFLIDGTFCPIQFSEQMFPDAEGTISAWIVQDDRMLLQSWSVKLDDLVELTNFTAQMENRDVRLTWQVGAISDVRGFLVERRAKNSVAEVVTPEMIPVQASKTYTWVDKTTASGVSYTYTVVAVETSGQRAGIGTTNILVPLPTTIDLAQNYPNPFNPTTTIRFVLPEAQYVELAIYDVSGKQVRLLTREWQEAGEHTLVWDARNESGLAAPSGVYTYRLKVGETVLIKKLTLLK